MLSFIHQVTFICIINVIIEKIATFFLHLKLLELKAVFINIYSFPQVTNQPFFLRVSTLKGEKNQQL